MSEQTEQTGQAPTTTGRGGCGCGGHGHAASQARAAAPAVVQPLGEGYREPEGVVPGHKSGNLLGLRDVSATGQGCGCGCGGH